MELAGAPTETLCYPGQAERAPGEAASTLGEHGGLGEHLHEAVNTLASSAAWASTCARLQTL
jgi:hypothetical protein